MVIKFITFNLFFTNSINVKLFLITANLRVTYKGIKSGNSDFISVVNIQKVDLDFITVVYQLKIDFDFITVVTIQ